jgi:hypothetical protein
MRVVAAFLVVVLLFHLQCGGSCVLNSSSSDPPCHQTPKHDQNGPCDQRHLTQSTPKIDLDVAGILAMDIETPVTGFIATAVFSPDTLSYLTPPSARFSILRI